MVDGTFGPFPSNHSLTPRRFRPSALGIQSEFSPNTEHRNTLSAFCLRSEGAWHLDPRPGCCRARARARDFKSNSRYATFENTAFPDPIAGWLAPSVRWHQDPLLSPALGILTTNRTAIQPDGLPENSRRQAPRRRRNCPPKRQSTLTGLQTTRNSTSHVASGIAFRAECKAVNHKVRDEELITPTGRWPQMFFHPQLYASAPNGAA